MAYADFGGTRRLSLTGLGGSFVLTGGMVAVLALMSPDLVRGVKAEYDRINSVSPTPPKIEPQVDEQVVPDDPTPPPVTLPDRMSYAAPPPLPRAMIPPADVPAAIPTPPVPAVVPEPKKPDPLPAAIPQPLPRAIVKTSARPDPRYARSQQPDYPMSMRRAGIEGRVTVRVLIGADGRVKDVTLVQSPDPAFFEVTREHALKNWRFKPATVDGQSVEAWFQMNLMFKLNDN